MKIILTEDQIKLLKTGSIITTEDKKIHTLPFDFIEDIETGQWDMIIGIQQQIESFLETFEKTHISYAPFETIEDILKHKEFERDDIDSNGWQYDFWATYKKGDMKIQVSGSWYYGNYTIEVI